MNPQPGQDPTPPASSSAEQDVTRIIADVENQLLRLKEADAQRKVLAAELEKRELELVSRQAQLAEAESALQAERETASELQHQSQAAREELEQRKHELAATELRLTEATEALKAERDRADQLEQQRQALQNQSGESQSQVGELRAELESHRERAESLTSETQKLRQQLESQRSELSASVQQTTEQRDRAIRELTEASDKAERFSAERDVAVRNLAEVQTKADRLAGELRAAQSDQGADVRELSARVEQAAQERDRARVELELLGERLDELTTERDELRKQLRDQTNGRKARSAAGTPMAPVRVESRMRRLRGMRDAIGARARKIRRAGEALQQRVEQCDLLLAQRRELAAAKRAIDVLHQRLEISKAKASSIVQLTAWVVTLTILAGLSWLIAGRLAPANFAATAVLASEKIGSTEGDQTAWTEFHIQLLESPRLIERVAARLQRRGMIEDASIDAVREVLDTRLVHREPAPGRLEIEIVSQGKGRAERWMETYVTALVAEANESRPRRRDGLSTVLQQPATVDSEPVSDPRPKYAGIGLAGAASFAAILWFGIWRAMARVRKKYEASNRLDEILNEARWVDPVPDVARRPARG